VVCVVLSAGVVVVKPLYSFLSSILNEMTRSPALFKEKDSP